MWYIERGDAHILTHMAKNMVEIIIPQKGKELQEKGKEESPAPESSPALVRFS